MPIDNLGNWRDIGYVSCLSYYWLPVGLSIYTMPLLRVFPSFVVNDFRGFFWLRYEDLVERSVTQSQRYYPEKDGCATLIEVETPAYIQRNFAFWNKTLEVMFIPEKGNKVFSPKLKIQEIG